MRRSIAAESRRWFYRVQTGAWLCSFRCVAGAARPPSSLAAKRKRGRPKKLLTQQLPAAAAEVAPNFHSRPRQSPSSDGQAQTKVHKSALTSAKSSGNPDTPDSIILAAAWHLLPADVRSTLDVPTVDRAAVGRGALGFLHTSLVRETPPKTVPFLARYRKDEVRGLTETQIEAVRDAFAAAAKVVTTRNRAIASLRKRGLLTPSLRAAFDAATTTAQLRQLWAPFTEKRITVAAQGRALGMEHLASAILDGRAVSLLPKGLNSHPPGALNVDAIKATDLEEVSVEHALKVLQTITQPAEVEKKTSSAERMDPMSLLTALVSIQVGALPSVQAAAASVAEFSAVVDVKGTTDGIVESRAGMPLRSMAPYRVLALNRDEAQGRCSISISDSCGATRQAARRAAVEALQAAAEMPERARFVAGLVDDVAANVTEAALRGARTAATTRAHTASALSLRRSLAARLLQRPLKTSVMLSVDPGFKAGCKCALLDGMGSVRGTAIQNLSHRAAFVSWVADAITRHSISSIVVGDGTASRETESVIHDALAAIPQSQRPLFSLVPEVGASVYSASAAARTELGHLDLLYRSAVSIGRRVLDPLSEWVKVPPQALGIGYYQHDLPPDVLAAAVRDETNAIVAAIGVSANTASPAVLAAVPGMSAAALKRIVLRRRARSFVSRQELEGVVQDPGVWLAIGGFVRVVESADPLDRTCVHPEQYAAARMLLSLLDRPLGDPDIPNRIAALGGANELGKSVVNACAARGIAIGGLSAALRLIKDVTEGYVDPRSSLPYAGIFLPDVRSVTALLPGKRLRGYVSSVAPFGAWIEAGVGESLFAHSSCIITAAADFDPASAPPADQVLHVGQVVDCVFQGTQVIRGETKYRCEVHMQSTVSDRSWQAAAADHGNAKSSQTKDVLMQRGFVV